MLDVWCGVISYRYSFGQLPKERDFGIFGSHAEERANNLGLTFCLLSSTTDLTSIGSQTVGKSDEGYVVVNETVVAHCRSGSDDYSYHCRSYRWGMDGRN